MKRVPLFTDHGDADDEFTMNLGDLPRTRPGLDVDGFQPTLASRFMDLVDRLRRR